jgi:ABC-type uncharacterized transport system substrate-binding protein
MRRREFIVGLGGAVAWPIAARAQQPKMARVGYLSVNSASTTAKNVEAVMAGLGDQGYVSGKNLAVEFRWADGHYDRLPTLAAELVRREVAVIIAPGSTSAALAAKAATQTIPVVIANGADPVELGLVASLARPGGNITGVTQLNLDMVTKRLELVYRLVPGSRSLGLLVNPANNAYTPAEVRASQVAAHALGVDLLVLAASNQEEVEAAFSLAVRQRADALIVSADTLFYGLRDHVVPLAAQHKVPTIYSYREFAIEGGLVSYGPSLPSLFRLVGVYAGRILNGEKPADLPVQQPTNFDLVINLKTAKALGITIPETLLATADEVIQ